MTASPEDDDQTVIRPITRMPAAQPRRPHGEHEEASHDLPAGTKLGEFELTEKIGEGGFSIVYAAWDHSLERKVAVKEYMPYSIATRKTPTTVNPRSEKHRDTFEAGLRSFINEAKLLAQFDHPSLVKVFRFWEANGTAYMVMPFYEGTTLKDTVRSLGRPPDEAWLLTVLAPLTEALKVIHSDQCYHRDIAPDNVMLLAETGSPLLLDFGAARRVIGDMTQALTVILKSGYAPVEQYAEVPDMKQGPWTDVYALAATVHWAITGKTPPAAVGRMLNDSYVPLAKSAAGLYSDRFLRGIDQALAIKPDNRTQTIEAFQRGIGLGQPRIKATTKATGDQARPPHTAAKWAGVSAVTATLAGLALWAYWPQSVAPLPKSPSSPSSSPSTRPSTSPTQATPAPIFQPAPPAPKAPTVQAEHAAEPKITLVPLAKATTTPRNQDKNQDKSKASNNRAECADILQRISLGESSPELMARFDRLHCH